MDHEVSKPALPSVVPDSETTLAVSPASKGPGELRRPKGDSPARLATRVSATEKLMISGFAGMQAAIDIANASSVSMALKSLHTDMRGITGKLAVMQTSFGTDYSQMNRVASALLASSPLAGFNICRQFDNVSAIVLTQSLAKQQLLDLALPSRKIVEAINESLATSARLERFSKSLVSHTAALNHLRHLQNHGLAVNFRSFQDNIDSHAFHRIHRQIVEASRAWEAFSHFDFEPDNNILIGRRHDERDSVADPHFLPRSGRSDTGKNETHTFLEAIIQDDVFSAIEQYELSIQSLTWQSPMISLVSFSMVHRLESELRKFITMVLERDFGPDWIDRHIDPVVSDRWREKRAIAIERGEDQYDIILYSELGDLIGVI